MSIYKPEIGERWVRVSPVNPTDGFAVDMAERGEVFARIIDIKDNNLVVFNPEDAEGFSSMPGAHLNIDHFANQYRKIFD